MKRLLDILKGKHPISAKRSGSWPTVRKHHLESHPNCAVCGGCDKIDVHHLLPFHLHPELELDAANLITLCESKKNGLNCHLWFGHLGNYKSFNASAVTDSLLWKEKMEKRP